MAFSTLFARRKERQSLLVDKQAFFDALGRADPTAICVLADKIAYDTKQAVLRAALSIEDAEELVNDAVVITITNIQNQKFLFSDFSPVAYAHGVVRKLIANRVRAKRPTQEISEYEDIISDDDPEVYLEHKDIEHIIGKLMGKLGVNCQQLLRLKYFDNLRDKEIVEQNLTPYNSTTSLKSKRNQCMNQLIELAKETDLFDKI